MKSKELHIWMGDNHPEVTSLYVTLESTETALYDGCDVVHTTQTHACSTTWLVRGYRLFVHMLDGETVEISLGCNNECTKKDIRVAHNIERMLLANAFGKATIDRD